MCSCKNKRTIQNQGSENNPQPKQIVKIVSKTGVVSKKKN